MVMADAVFNVYAPPAFDLPQWRQSQMPTAFRRTLYLPQKSQKYLLHSQWDAEHVKAEYGAAAAASQRLCCKVEEKECSSAPMLRNLNALDLFPDGATVAGAVFAYDTHLGRVLRLLVTITAEDGVNKKKSHRNQCCSSCLLIVYSHVPSWAQASGGGTDAGGSGGHGRARQIKRQERAAMASGQSNELGLHKHHSVAVGPSRGFPAGKRSLPERPSRRKGRLGKRTKMVKEVVKEVAGQAPYERRLLELLRVGREKRALKVAKKKVFTPSSCCAPSTALARCVFFLLFLWFSGSPVFFPLCCVCVCVCVLVSTAWWASQG